MSNNPNHDEGCDRGANGPGRRHTIRPPGSTPPEDPSSGPVSADRLTTIAHELHNMLDGSMRWLGLAAATLPDGAVASDAEKLESARAQIGTVQGTLERMSSMVNAALRSRSVGVGSPLLGVSSTVSLGMAIDHAVDVVRPLASDRGVQIEVSISADAGTISAGPLYTVILNGMVNSIESIGRSAERDTLNPGGTVSVAAKVDDRHHEVVVEISDDGSGLDRSVRGEAAFEHGRTTRPDGCGIGLAISRQIVDQMEGVISLHEREDRTGSHRPGAVLRVRIPMNSGDEQIENRRVG